MGAEEPAGSELADVEAEGDDSFALDEMSESEPEDS
jgi:hypothetical protein